MTAKAPRNDLPKFALSVQQPWAWAIICAGKDVENRTWKPPEDLLGQRLWLHVSKEPQNIEPEDAVPAGSRLVVPRLAELPLGVIVGSFLLVGTASSSMSPWYAPGAIAWRIAEPVALLTPVPARGMPGIWSVSAELLKELTAR